MEHPMKRFSWLPAAVLLALAACKGDGTGPQDDVATVQVMPDQRVLAVGEVLQLTPVVRDEGGEVPSDDRMDDLVWSTDNAAVVTVSPAGVVTGVAVGTANVRAELEGVSGTVQVKVAAVPAACNVPSSLRSLELGGSLVLGGVEAATVCLEGGALGREYVAVPFHAGDANAPQFSVRMTGQGIIPVAPGSASLAPSFTFQGREQDASFHERLRRRAERELAPHVGTAIRGGHRDALRPSLALDLRSATVGQQVVVNTSLESCENPKNRTGRVMAVGQRSVVLADMANPAGGLTNADYASMAAGFDTLVYPVVTQTFGEPGDVDDNAKVVIFYTSAVNALTPAGSGSFVGGFFHPRDLFPVKDSDGLAACATTNFAEMVYMLVPDPQGTVNNNVFTRESIVQTSLGTIAHELQHLINASRRLYVVQTTHWNEETWLNEGLSHIAEEVLFYHAAGLAPRQNISWEQTQATPRVRNAYVTYMDQNIRRYQRFLEQHESQSPYDATTDDDNDLATRGASWAFARYAADRRAGSDTQLWHDLVDSDVIGLANLQQALGADPRPLVRDWTTAVYTDDLVSNLEARFTQPSWRFRTFFNSFPAGTRNLAGGEITTPLKSGSGAYVRFGVAPGQVGTFTARRTGGEPLTSQVYVTFVRTR
jgi:hypothetical protein